MQVDVNWLAVVVAGLSVTVVGSIFYARPVFGNMWIKLAKLDKDELAKNPIRPIVITIILSFLMAFVIAHVASVSRTFYEVSALSSALTSAFWLWLGISAVTVAVHDVFEHRPAKLTFLTVAYQFFAMMAMGLIIGLFGGF